MVQIDVTDEKSIQAVKEHIETQFGKVDVLINNAGEETVPLHDCKMRSIPVRKLKVADCNTPIHRHHFLPRS